MKPILWIAQHHVMKAGHCAAHKPSFLHMFSSIWIKLIAYRRFEVECLTIFLLSSVSRGSAGHKGLEGNKAT